VLPPNNIFQTLSTPQIVEEIVKNTNSYAERARAIDPLFPHPRTSPQPWKPVCASDLRKYIGCRLWMRQNYRRNLDGYRSKKGDVAKATSKNRYEQIHRYLTPRDGATCSLQEKETIAWQVEPIASQIKANVQAFYVPGSHLTIDEAMICFRGRSHHKVILPNEPIKEGYKIWTHGAQGLIDDWL
jgi:Transposase IS4